MTEHSNVMGGSTAARRVNCPGSYQMEKDIPGKSSEFADRGSMLHAAMELIFQEDPANTKELQPLLNELQGQDMGFEGHEITEDLIADKIAPAMRAWWEIDAEYDIVEIFIEQRVTLEEIVPGAFGTSDIFGVDASGRLHVLDWKFGDGVPVPVEENIGLGFYAACVLNDPDPDINDFCQQLPPADESMEVVLHIIQPRAGIEQCRFTWQTDDIWIDQLTERFAETEKLMHVDNPPLKTGDWCKFCRGKLKCPEYQNMTVAVQGKAPDQMTAVQLGDYLEKAKLLEGWIKDLNVYALEQAKAGVQIPGFKLVEGREGPRQFEDAAAAEEICKKSRVKADDMYDKKLKSPTQLEKTAPNVYKKKLAALVTRAKGKLVLAPETDKRPAVSGSMQLLGAALSETKQETGNSK